MGSEMCIRDRVSPGEGNSSRLTKVSMLMVPHTITAGAAEALVRRGVMRAILLDAADEGCFS